MFHFFLVFLAGLFVVVCLLVCLFVVFVFFLNGGGSAGFENVWALPEVQNSGKNPTVCELLR